MKVHMARAKAVTDGANIRRCASCGAEIDPIDWCSKCQQASEEAGREVGHGGSHKRPRKRADAAFCNDECRWVHRNSFIRDCT